MCHSELQLISAISLPAQNVSVRASSIARLLQISFHKPTGMKEENKGNI